MQIKTETRVGLFIIVALSIFFYISFHLDIFRFDKAHYRKLIICFNDVSGLTQKADVKIAGVKVGWVEKIELMQDRDYQPKAYIMVHKNYVVYQDAQALVRQEGLLGTKYLEIVPGGSHLPPFEGQLLNNLGRSPVSVDAILCKMQTISENVEDITNCLQYTLGDQAREQLKVTIENVAKASDKFASFAYMIDRDFNHLSNTVQDAAIHIRDSFKNIHSIAEKIDCGQGLVGKLINEEETYQDLQFAVHSAKNYFAKIDALAVVLDSHGEFMFRPAENFPLEDAKGYFGVRIHPNDEYFYIFQVVNSLKGNLRRRTLRRAWFDEKDNPLLTSELLEKRIAIPELVGKVDDIVRYPDSKKYSLQFGKIFKNVALRFGLFENSAGFGIDFDIPFGTDNFRWVTTFEIFDFRGRDRINDSRPHVKWLNRLFILRNIYMAFGADDFVSRKNANTFFGTGIRFSDEDIKFIGSRFGLAGIVG